MRDGRRLRLPMTRETDREPPGRQRAVAVNTTEIHLELHAKKQYEYLYRLTLRRRRSRVMKKKWSLVTACTASLIWPDNAGRALGVEQFCTALAIFTKAEVRAFTEGIGGYSSDFLPDP